MRTKIFPGHLQPRRSNAQSVGKQRSFPPFNSTYPQNLSPKFYLCPINHALGTGSSLSSRPASIRRVTWGRIEEISFVFLSFSLARRVTSQGRTDSGRRFEVSMCGGCVKTEYPPRVRGGVGGTGFL